MKNLHLISTDKYSPLAHYSPMKEMGDSYKNIYITNLLEIKVGDWVITYNGLLAKVITETEWHFINSNKIILTTDANLIKDGVQEIDEEFLEWFVKNPSCEEVEVVTDRVFRFDEFHGREFFNRHKIVIPKEEPKQENLEEVAGSDLVKTDWNLRECFKQLRFDKNHHLGLGDIRITIAQQDEICDLVERFYNCRHLKKTNMENKQTAIEWLFKQLWEEPKDKFTWNTILSKAKEMEKEQIIDAYIEASENPALILQDAEDYYNETFKKD